MQEIAITNKSDIPLTEAKLLEYPTLLEYFELSGRLNGEDRFILPFHKAICEALTQVVMGTLPDGKRKLAINMPPGHGKTFLMQSFLEWSLGVFPEARFIYASYSADLAENSTFAILNNVTSDWFQKVFPACKILAEFKKREYFNTDRKGYVKGVGFKGTITGFRAGRLNMDEDKSFGGAIIIDDPMKADDAYSPIAKEAAIGVYYSTISNRTGSKETPIIAIGQRLAPDDFFGRLFEREGDQWVKLCFPGLDENDVALWESMKSAKDYINLREVDEFTYWAQVQQKPQCPGGNIIKREWWRYFSGSEYNVDGELIITADTAMKKTDKNDNSSFQVWNMSENHLDLIEEVTGKWEFPELVSKAQMLYAKWNGICTSQSLNSISFYVEDKASGAPMAQMLGSIGIPCKLWSPKKYNFPEGKLQRVKMCLFHLRGGHVRLPIYDGTNEWVLNLIEQCANFTGLTEEHDDSVDTMTMAFSIWRMRGGGLDTVTDSIVTGE